MHEEENLTIDQILTNITFSMEPSVTSRCKYIQEQILAQESKTSTACSVRYIVLYWKILEGKRN